MKKKNLLMTSIAIFGLATITFGQTVPSYIPTSGLVGWWPFNGNANDESGNGNNGAPGSGVLITTDRFLSSNAAYDFNGSGNISLTSLPTTGSQDFTISGWVKTNNTTVRKGIACWGQDNPWNSTYFYITADGYLKFDFAYNGGPQSPIFIADNNWHSVTITCTSGLVQLYLDGIATGTALSMSPNISGSNKALGANIDNSGSNNFVGKLDDFGIWNRALTQQEITDLYNGCQLAVNSQPASQTININNTAQFLVGASVTSATFQWQTDLGVGFQNLNSVGQYSGTTNDTLTVSNVTMSNNNQPFRCIVSSGSCSDTSNVAVLTVNNNVGINEFTQDNLFSVYPNPAHSQINVKADATLLGSVYTVYDNTGKVVLSGKIISENTVIELGNLSGGIYLFSVGENLKQTFKVIKE
jgi:hypothetical protein